MKFLKWLGAGIGALLVLVLAFAGWATFRTYRVTHRTWDVTVRTVPIPTDSASLARGEHLARAVAKCADCHGADLSGGPVIDDPAFARIFAPNLTRGRGGAGARFTSDVAWVSAIRHGLTGAREPLAIMPAEAFRFMSDADLGAVIAYVKSVPPVDHEWPARHFGPVGTVLIALGKAQLFPATMIDQTREGMQFPSEDTTADYGHYLADIGGCTSCHNPAMSGGPRPGGPPGAPPPLNLTRGGIPQWTEADFIRALREGRTPDGRELNNAFMPWRSSGLMTDAEIHAVWLWIRSLPARQMGEQ